MARARRAADVLTHGPDAPWGEHEVDYLLIAKLKPGEVLPMTPNPDEVSDVAWVTEAELKEKMGVGRWSPWFPSLR